MAKFKVGDILQTTQIPPEYNVVPAGSRGIVYRVQENDEVEGIYSACWTYGEFVHSGYVYGKHLKLASVGSGNFQDTIAQLEEILVVNFGYKRPTAKPEAIAEFAKLMIGNTRALHELAAWVDMDMTLRAALVAMNIVPGASKMPEVQAASA